MNIKNENIKCNMGLYKDNDLNVIPILSYFDANKSKLLLCYQNRQKSGIYCWNNKITGKSYIGSAVNLAKRLRSYYSFNFLKRELLRNKSYIYSALLKYGHSNFNIHILEYCDKDILLTREQYYIDSLNPEYNILKIAGSCIGRKHSEETKVKLSKSAKLRKGKETSFFGKNHKFEVKSLISIKKSINIKVIDLETDFTKTFLGNKKAAEYLKVSVSTLTKFKNLKKPIKNRFLVLNARWLPRFES